MNVVYWGIQSATGGVWTQDGTQLHLTLANPKDGEMVATINGQNMEGEWHVPEKTRLTPTASSCRGLGENTWLTDSLTVVDKGCR